MFDSVQSVRCQLIVNILARKPAGVVQNWKEVADELGYSDDMMSTAIRYGYQTGVLTPHCTDWKQADMNVGNLPLWPEMYCVGIAIRRN